MGQAAGSDLFASAGVAINTSVDVHTAEVILPPRAIPKAAKAHSALVQISTVGFTDFTIRLWYALLAIAREDLRNGITVHTIKLADLMDSLGTKTRNWGFIRKHMQLLKNNDVNFNLLGKDKELQWIEENALVAGFRILRGGVLEWGMSPLLAEHIANPRIFVLLAQNRLNKLKGVPAVQLYAIVYDYIRKNGDRRGETPWETVGTWRRLLGVPPGKHTEYKYLKRDVIKVAMERANEHTNSIIELEERTGANGVVEYLKFRGRLKTIGERKHKLSHQASRRKPKVDQETVAASLMTDDQYRQTCSNWYQMLSGEVRELVREMALGFLTEEDQKRYSASPETVEAQSILMEGVIEVWELAYTPAPGEVPSMLL